MCIVKVGFCVECVCEMYNLVVVYFIDMVNILGKLRIDYNNFLYDTVVIKKGVKFIV